MQGEGGNFLAYCVKKLHGKSTCKSEDLRLLGKEAKHVLSKHLVLLCAASEFSDLPPFMTLLICSDFSFEIL